MDIPAQGPANPSFLEVDGVEGEVTGIAVTLEGLSHNYNGNEIVVVLTNPDGIPAALFDGLRCALSGNGPVVLRDDAPANLTAGCSSGPLRAGTYNLGAAPGRNSELTIPIAPVRPYLQTLTELALPTPTGRWILWAEDFVNGDPGRIRSWSITIETDAPDDEAEAQ